MKFHQNAQATALQMGHSTTNMLFAHYYKRVSKKDAAEFWNITPPTGWMLLPPQTAPKPVSATPKELLSDFQDFLEQREGKSSTNAA